MATSPSEQLSELPPSAKLVFYVLKQQSPLTQKGICDETLLADRTVRYALKRLDENDLIERKFRSAMHGNDCILPLKSVKPSPTQNYNRSVQGSATTYSILTSRFRRLLLALQASPLHREIEFIDCCHYR